MQGVVAVGDPAQWVPLEPDLLRKIERFQITRSVSSLGWLVPFFVDTVQKLHLITGGGQESSTTMRDEPTFLYMQTCYVKCSS